MTQAKKESEDKHLIELTVLRKTVAIQQTREDIIKSVTLDELKQ